MRGQGRGSLEVVCAGEADGDSAPTVLHFSLQALQTRGSKLALRLQAALRRWRFKQAIGAVCELLQDSAKIAFTSGLQVACVSCELVCCWADEGPRADQQKLTIRNGLPLREGLAGSHVGSWAAWQDTMS